MKEFKKQQGADHKSNNVNLHDCTLAKSADVTERNSRKKAIKHYKNTKMWKKYGAIEVQL